MIDPIPFTVRNSGTGVLKLSKEFTTNRSGDETTVPTFSGLAISRWYDQESFDHMIAPELK